MIIQLTGKKDNVAVNTDKILFASPNGKYTRIDLEDGTGIDVYETLEQICSLANVKISIENTKV